MKEWSRRSGTFKSIDSVGLMHIYIIIPAISPNVQKERVNKGLEFLRLRTPIIPVAIFLKILARAPLPSINLIVRKDEKVPWTRRDSVTAHERIGLIPLQYGDFESNFEASAYSARQAGWCAAIDYPM